MSADSPNTNPILYIVERTKQARVAAFKSTAEKVHLRLKAQGDAQVQGRVNDEQRKNQELQDKLDRLKLINDDREQANLTLKAEVFSAEAALATQQILLGNRLKQEEVHRKTLSDVGQDVKQTIKDHVLGRLSTEQQSQIIDAGKRNMERSFDAASELQNLASLKEKVSEAASAEIDVMGLQEAEQESDLENAVLRKQLQQRSSKLHEMKLRLNSLRSDIDETSANHKRMLSQIVAEGQATQERHQQAVTDLKGLEARVLAKFKDIAANEKEQRRLRQALRFA